MVAVVVVVPVVVVVAVVVVISYSRCSTAYFLLNHPVQHYTRPF